MVATAAGVAQGGALWQRIKGCSEAPTQLTRPHGSFRFLLLVFIEDAVVFGALRVRAIPTVNYRNVATIYYSFAILYESK